ncbi:MAG TPA: hypothetical protein VNZ01_13810 [Solirubrobacteraceae bacterium]|jgi:hypothetical protein|nr:hypothetical protein [Solirubrobacteraceae bacterium]
MASSTRRISVGFHGGQVLSLRVEEKQWKALSEALGGAGWLDVESEDGPVRVNLGQVSYVSADSSEPHVGFG